MKLEELKPTWIEQYKKPMIIAGPCSAESETQMLETAKGIKLSGAEVSVFRAGIWKPRTKPNGFEGVGEIGLKWLRKVKEEYGFRTATEVANAHHVLAALEADVDILWIGARSTANPFTVQEIAMALRDTTKTVLVKNPVNPDLGLWVGALERLVGQNVTQLGVIHRGFSSYQKSKYRNNPNWQIALDFIRQYPHIPVLNDPSHICGNRTGLAEVSQEAMNCGFAGLMIETHCSPDDAWTDAEQQITPDRLAEMIAHLKIRNLDLCGYDEEINRRRTQISDLDFQLIELLSQRMKLSEKIGSLKKENNIAVFQPDRWKTIAEYSTMKAEESGMSREFIEKVFRAIHEESVEIQNRLMH
ncbi:MAG: 3-deoxy-7-phosphoheptulonate synthase [Chryseobacterium sp.]|nr:MAG: 3-deoxy-7-phosphoheptulonate synthase [Chryseobacterium sp.]